MDPAPQPHPDGNGREHPDEDEPHDEPERPREPLRRRAVRWRREHPRGALLALILFVVIVAVAVVVWWHMHTHESTDDAQIDGHIAPLSTRISGTVTGVFVEDNQPVNAGQLLVQLDPRDYEVALARAEAELAQARAQLAAQSPTVPITATTNVTQIATTGGDVDTARAAIASAERDYQSQLAHVRAAEANETRAQADLARYKYLVGQRAIPQERYDQIVATAKSTHAELDAARAVARAALKTVEQQRLRLQQAESRHGEASTNAQSQITIREANIEAQRAVVKAAQAAVERAKLDLSYTKIVAPVAGVVGRRSVEPGQRVQPGESLLAVVELDNLWVTANFKETQLRRLRVGQPARISVDALGVTLDGSVESLAGASGSRYSLLPPENATGNYVKVVQRLPVRIKLAPNQDPQHRLRVGMSVDPTVALR